MYVCICVSVYSHFGVSVSSCVSVSLLAYWRIDVVVYSFIRVRSYFVFVSLCIRVCVCLCTRVLVYWRIGVFVCLCI